MTTDSIAFNILDNWIFVRRLNFPLFIKHLQIESTDSISILSSPLSFFYLSLCQHKTKLSYWSSPSSSSITTTSTSSSSSSISTSSLSSSNCWSFSILYSFFLLYNLCSKFRPRMSAAHELKDKLLQVLLAHSYSILANTGSPIDQVCSLFFFLFFSFFLFLLLFVWTIAITRG